MPKDVVRIINGLAHLPIDAMRAIAVLDAPADVITRYAITDEEQRDRIISGELALELSPVPVNAALAGDLSTSVISRENMGKDPSGSQNLNLKGTKC